MNSLFRDLHAGPAPLLVPNPYDVGTAKLLAGMGFAALATSSAGLAATLGRRDGSITRNDALQHGKAIAAAVGVPVSADLENGFADGPAEVADTVRRAKEAGLAGCSIEDFSRRGERIYGLREAAERVQAAAEAARASSGDFVLTARAENHLHGRHDLDDTIARLQAFEEAGADVLYAPGLLRPADISRVVQSVTRPVNVLALPGGPSVTELADLGVRRVSLGAALTWAAMGAVAEAAREFLGTGTLSFFAAVRTGHAVASPVMDS